MVDSLAYRRSFASDAYIIEYSYKNVSITLYTESYIHIS
jgi:hypothetical protein